MDLQFRRVDGLSEECWIKDASTATLAVRLPWNTGAGLRPLATGRVAERLREACAVAYVAAHWRVLLVSRLSSEAGHVLFVFGREAGAVVRPGRTENGPMKIRNSLKSLRGRHRDNSLVRRHGRLYVINKTQRRFKARQG